MNNHNYFNIYDADISITDVDSILREEHSGFWRTEQKPSYNQLFYVLEGEYNIYIDNKSVRICENDVLFLPRNTAYRAEGYNKNFSFIGIYFSVLEPEPETFFHKFQHIRNLKNMKNQFREIARMFSGTQPGRRLRLKKALYSILENLTSASFSGDAICRYYSTIKNAADYIEENYMNNDISCVFLANLCNITPTHFAKTFKMAYNITPKEYIIRMRMKRAEEYLIYSAYSVMEISSLLGYSDPAYFSAAFKRIYGVSPSAYRKNSL